MPRTEFSIPIGIPVNRAYIRYSQLPRTQGIFDPAGWDTRDLVSEAQGWFRVQVADLRLAGDIPLTDGTYEYEFVVERAPNDPDPIIVADPYAKEITRFGGYRGIFHIHHGAPVDIGFAWDGELPVGVQLPGNHEMVIYELPMRWVDAGEDGLARQVGLGTFDKAIFEVLFQYIASLGVNTVELLPIQDSPDTLNWGYGTRFFFAPDYDMGTPLDLKLFIKECHKRGIRVILDIVMNHSKKCPLEQLAPEWFYIDPKTEELIVDSPDKKEHRDGWGGKPFRYRDQRNGSYMARQLHYDVATYWINEYHIDGFRIDEFKGINNWEFLRQFRYRALKAHRAAFPGRPFIVIAEDSWRRANATVGTYWVEPHEDISTLRVTDAIWDFDFRDEVRRIVSNTLHTELEQPGRHKRVVALLKGDKLWNGSGWREHSFTDLAQRITYCTSHDVEAEGERRLYSFYLDRMRSQWDSARKDYALDAADVPEFDTLAREMIVSTFALMLTCRGIPMFLAGEEFGDLHDVDPGDWRKKMSDPVDWYRRQVPGHALITQRVSELVQLRANRAVDVLHRTELEFFGMDGIAKGFQQDFDDTVGGRVFAYCRPGDQPLGSTGQVVIVANCGWQTYPSFSLQWPWAAHMAPQEFGGKGQPAPVVASGAAELALDPFQVRVFRLG